MTVLLVDPRTRRRRTGRLALVLARCGAARLVPGRPRRRRQVCTAADVLTAAGVRVEVHPPDVPWPRREAGRVVVANRVSRLDDLALRTVVPDVVVRPEQLRDRTGTGPACPVAVRCRTEDGADLTALLAGEEELSRAVRRALAVRDLVVEVHLLPSLPSGGDDAQVLTGLAERAIARRLSSPAGRGAARRSAA